MKTAQNLASPAATGLLAAGLLACSFGSSPVVSREMLAHQIESGTAPIVLDVRSESEYESGHVPGAIHIPFQSDASRLEEISLDKEQPIVVYCAHGPRAAWAGRGLRDAGYTSVVYLEGHMASWERDGLPQELKSAQNAESEK